MRFRHKSARPWLWVLILAVVATRLCDAHLHLCFDGLEPPAAMHMADGAVHNDAHHVDTEHSDQDVDLLDAVLVKSGERFLDQPFILATSFLLLLLRPVGGGWPSSADYQAQPHPPFHLRPPLRGPPR